MNPAAIIPTHPEAIAPNWMTHVLREAGVIQQAQVTSIRTELVANQGIVGQVIRLHLSYDREEENQVSSIIAKFPSDNPDLRKGLQHLYRNEILFYKNLPPELGMTVPKPYYAAIDESSGDNLLLLEDLSVDSRPGNIVFGCTLEEAETALSRLAKFHATWWGEKHQERFGWLPHKSAYLKKETKDQFSAELDDWTRKIEEVIPGFHFSASFLKSAGLMAKNYLRIKNFLYNAPATLVHDDFKLDNMIFRGSQKSPELVLLDWHLVCRASGVCDLGYFIGFCLSTEQRKQAEQDLVKVYYTTLCENGVHEYDFSRFLLEYRLSALEPLERIVSVRFALDQLSPPMISYFQSLLARLCPFIEDCQIDEMLG